MGLGGISIWQLLIILAIVLVAFGTKRLKNMGSDLGGAVKGFKKAIKDDDSPGEQSNAGQLDNRQSEANADQPHATPDESLAATTHKNNNQ